MRVETQTVELRGTGTTATLCRKLLGDQSFRLGEVPPTLTDGGNTRGRVCGGVVTDGQAAIDVLTSSEDQVTALGIFVEPQLPMTHLRSIDDRSAEVGDWQNERETKQKNR